MLKIISKVITYVLGIVFKAQTSSGKTSNMFWHYVVITDLSTLDYGETVNVGFSSWGEHYYFDMPMNELLDKPGSFGGYFLFEDE